MSQQLIKLLIIAVTIIGVAFVIGLVFSYLKKKGIKTGEILESLGNGLEEVKTGLAVIKEVAPETPKLALLELIEKWAEIGVKYAQQMYISSQLAGDKRKEAAVNIIITILMQLNITITDDLRKLINDTVESKVFDLKTPEEQKVATQNVLTQQVNSLQSSVQQLQTSNNELACQNTQLSQKINTIQSTLA